MFAVPETASAASPSTLSPNAVVAPSDTSILEVLRRPIESAQYTSAQYANLAADLGVTLSVGRKGQCWDNAVAESFFATVKTELIHRRSWLTRKAATSALLDYIEGWYNTHRRHSTLGYLSPTQYESTITLTAEQIA